MSSLDVYHMLPPFGFIVQLHLNQKKPFVKDFMVMLIIRNPRIVGAPIRGQGMAYSAISYPNTWGYIAFQAMLMIWYLYAREKQLFTFAMFWCMAGFMFFVIGSKTVALLSVLVPFASLLIAWLEKRTRQPGKKPGIFAWIIIALPILCYIFSIAVSFQMEWVKKTFLQYAALLVLHALCTGGHCA